MPSALWLRTEVPTSLEQPPGALTLQMLCSPGAQEAAAPGVRRSLRPNGKPTCTEACRGCRAWTQRSRSACETGEPESCRDSGRAPCALAIVLGGGVPMGLTTGFGESGSHQQAARAVAWRQRAHTMRRLDWWCRRRHCRRRHCRRRAWAKGATRHAHLRPAPLRARLHRGGA